MRTGVPRSRRACRPACKHFGGTIPLTETAYRIELKPPDITAYRSGNTGIDFVTTFDSGKSGPHVLVNALTHGNELCGAIALDFLFRQGVRPVRGKLTLCFANVAAYQCFDASRPGASRFVDEDFNRALVSPGSGRPPQLGRTDPRPGAETALRYGRSASGPPFHAARDTSAGAVRNDRARAAAGPGGSGARMDRQRQRPCLRPPPAGLCRFRRCRSAPRPALLAECGQHWERARGIRGDPGHSALPDGHRRRRSGIRRPSPGAGTAAGAESDRDHRRRHHEGLQSGSTRPITSAWRSSSARAP